MAQSAHRLGTSEVANPVGYGRIRQVAALDPSGRESGSAAPVRYFAGNDWGPRAPRDRYTFITSSTLISGAGETASLRTEDQSARHRNG